MGRQKNWVTSKKILNQKDWKLSYSEQSQKILEINSIPINDKIPKINISIKKIEHNNVDLNRVYALGYSNGGGFTFDLGCRLNNKITGIGVVARTMYAESYDNCEVVHPTPVVTILGNEDSISNYDGIVVRSSTKVTKKIIEKSNRLKVIARAGVGVDNVNVTTATNRGIVVMNSPQSTSRTTAEHAISLVFSLARKIPFAHHSTIQKKMGKRTF